jgi:hypothetical protein
MGASCAKMPSVKTPHAEVVGVDVPPRFACQRGTERRGDWLVGMLAGMTPILSTDSGVSSSFGPDFFYVVKSLFRLVAVHF